MNTLVNCNIKKQIVHTAMCDTRFSSSGLDKGFNRTWLYEAVVNPFFSPPMQKRRSRWVPKREIFLKTMF